MLISQDFLETLKRIHQNGKYMPGLAYDWSVKSKKFTISCERRYRHWSTIWLVVLSFLGILNVALLRNLWWKGDIVTFSIGFVKCTCLTVAMFIIWFISTRPETCVWLFNGILDLENENADNSKTEGKYTKSIKGQQTNSNYKV